jgi:hypothetical protein
MRVPSQETGASLPCSSGFTPKAIEEELKVSSAWYSLGFTQGVPAGFIKMEKSKPFFRSVTTQRPLSCQSYTC